MQTYRTCYRTLGVSGTCGWETLRLSFRRRVRRCHPDLLPEQSGVELTDRRADREEEFKRVVRAYRLLADYRRRNGILPPPYLPVQNDRDSSNEDWRRQKMPAQRRPDSSARRRRERWPPKPLMSRFHRAVVGTFLLIVATFALLNGHGGETFRSAVRTSGERLAVGMDTAEVVNVQGVPSHTRGSVWFYGKSGVIFEKGCVIGWESRPPLPLRTLVSKAYLTRHIDAAPDQVLQERIECTLPEK